MPTVNRSTPITALYGQQREGARYHYFIGGNFFLQSLLDEHRDDLKTVARTQDLEAAVARTATSSAPNPRT